MSIKDLSVLIGVILIIAMLVIPLPGSVLSFLIIVNISLALLVILVAMNMQEPLQFSIFPSLILLLTLFRLGLNVSTTRSILSKGEAGGVVETFGTFVVGGNPLVGFVVFLILVIIQFLVITKGSERVSEVAARFTLDAMPGKQMSIDADLNAGIINDKQAKARREKVENEADFYGAMDGATKFVKGDSIAGIIIVIINILVGMIIGVAQMDLSIGESSSKFTLLTVGDGLVSQIPALLISTATGIVVTRAASKGNLGSDVSEQLLRYPKLLYVAAATIFGLGVATPINNMLTIPIAGFLVYGGYSLTQKQKVQEEAERKASEEKEEEVNTSLDSNNVSDLLNVDPIEFEFGYALIPYADKSEGGDLLDRIVRIRRQLALDLGIIVPSVRIRDNIQLEPNEYRVSIKGNVVASYQLVVDHHLAISPGFDDETVEGLETIEPSFGIPSKWITEDMKEHAELSGYTVIDNPSVISTHLTEVIKKNAHNILGRQETKELIEHLKNSHPALVEEVVPNLISIGDIQKVLRNLLKENISIRNLPEIFESIADHAPITNDTSVLTEYVRQSLQKQITNQFKQENQVLPVITISNDIEQMIAQSVQHTEHGNLLNLDPLDAQLIAKSISDQVEKVSQQRITPIIICTPGIRMYLRQLTESFMADVPVLSYNELEPTIQIESQGMVNI
ncbi:flagellar biosynthesis protein FlhA (plasmid) [Rossellomorea sp. AcN35-11]|nr:flagellar biosynthesis protein FlhA [Rossellomorea aquimaris]WJV32299.1 flagellar biosynthesis protein FlhA [Rossellomorea sp. AcN35-11]